MYATILLLISIGYLDYLTGYEIGFFVFYFLPLGIAAWYHGKKTAIATSIIAAIVWHAADILSGHAHSAEYIRYWNSIVRLISFTLFSFLLASLRTTFDKEVELNRELKKALTEIKKLTGLLPICASCKKIRNDKGYWEQLEVYIEDHSDAQFSHGICPDCAKKLYPEYYKE